MSSAHTLGGSVCPLNKGQESLTGILTPPRQRAPGVGGWLGVPDWVSPVPLPSLERGLAAGGALGRAVQLALVSGSSDLAPGGRNTAFLWSLGEARACGPLRPLHLLEPCPR